MKHVITAALIFATPFASAGITAQEAALYQRDCELIGKIGRVAFTETKKNGKFEAPASFSKLHHAALATWAVNYGTKSAIDETDAFRMSYAKCQDNLARVYRNNKAGKVTTLEELD